MRLIFPAAFLALLCAGFSSQALAEWDGAYEDGYDDTPVTSGRPLPAYDAQRSGAYSSPVRQVNYPGAQPPAQPAVNYQTPAIPDYLPQTKAQAQTMQLYGTPAGTPIAGQTQIQQPYSAPLLYAAQPASPYYGQPQQPAAPSYYTQQSTASYQAPAPVYPQAPATPAYAAAPAPQQYAQAYTTQQSYSATSYAQPQPPVAQAYAQQQYAQPAYPADPYQQAYTQPAYAQPQYAQSQYSQLQSGQPAQPYTSYSYDTQQQYSGARSSDSDSGPSFSSEPGRKGARGFYLALKTGISIPETVKSTTGGVTVQSEYKSGWNLATALGYAFAPWAPWVAPRADAELGFIRNSIDSLSFGGTKFSDPAAYGDLTELDFMVNGYTDFYLSRYFQPYLGAGFGLGYLDLDRQGTNPTGVTLDNDNVGFAWRIGTGVNLPLGGGSMLDVGYHYQQAVGIGMTSIAGTKSDIDVGNHVIQVGVRTPVSF